MFKKIFATLGFICILSSTALAVPYSDVPNCEVQVRCSFGPPLAWATDGANCMVFYNGCHLRNKNCERLSKGQKILTEVNREQCLQYCRPGCTKEFNPVCTELEKVSKTFENPCLWSQEMCKTGKAYVYQFQGTCQPISP